MSDPEVTTAPAVSVAVCTRNRADRLAGALDSVRAAMDVAELDGRLTVELVVVDNGSTDATPQVLRDLAAADPRVRVVVEPEPGLGNARRRAVATTRGSCVLFTDDDVVVPPEWVVRLSRPLLAGRADLVAGGVAMADDLRRPWMTPDLVARYFAHVPDPPEVNPGLVGANMGATRDVLRRIPFDEALGTSRYPGAEDVLLYVQALESGDRVAPVSDAVVLHRFDPDRLGSDRLRRQAQGYGRCDAYFYHHWLHADLSWPRARIAVHGLHLALRRLATRDPYDEELLRLAREVAFHREMLSLRHVPPRYERRGARRPAPERTP